MAEARQVDDPLWLQVQDVRRCSRVLVEQTGSPGGAYGVPLHRFCGAFEGVGNMKLIDELDNEELTIFATRLAAELQAEHDSKFIPITPEHEACALEAAGTIDAIRQRAEDSCANWTALLQAKNREIVALTQEKDAIIDSQGIEIESMETVAMQNVELRAQIAGLSRSLSIANAAVVEYKAQIPEGYVLVPKDELHWMESLYDDTKTPHFLSLQLYDVSCTARKILAAQQEAGK